MRLTMQRKQILALYGDIELMFTAGVDDGDSGKDVYMEAYNEAAKWLKAHPDKTINDFAGLSTIIIIMSQAGS